MPVEKVAAKLLQLFQIAERKFNALEQFNQTNVAEIVSRHR